MLKLPLPEAQSELKNRTDAGRELANTPITSIEGVVGLPPGPSQADHARQELRELRSSVGQWRDYNRTWLSMNLGGEAADEYEHASTHPYFGAADNPVTDLRFLREDIESEISKLESIYDRLDLWAPQDDRTSASGTARPPNDGPIFIVHGSDTLRAERVARTVKEATGRQTIILREQASLGRTLIEKFEHNAAKVSYAIVVLTPDDEGGRKDQGVYRPRGRQNVILEMGYFYGILGRSRVCVLVHPDVERPSDIDGIVYISFDDSGAWKTELFRELEHAQIHTDMSRAF